MRWRLGEARARVSSEPSAAIELAVEATRIADSTDMTPLRADSWHARADVAVAMNERDEALRAAGMAESLYRSKGIVPAAEKLKKLAVTASALP